ncbi:endonuclease/exonuclease/phosphatase family protein [Nitrososphaera viennensis]|nr:endonuclease/exonuclease/phosphatase family protein [Nitrososphaera viennensis]UVS68377.1 endonuclease/exonuclease/phosphatase family protein [Nitrososphaera viennensis]
MIAATWNMQGSSHSQENKWNEGVKNMMVQLNIDVFCLQECGSVPASANLLQNNFGGIVGLSLYSWGGTTTRPFAYILFYPADPNGNRCNLAVVSKVLPANPALLYPAAAPVWRPALGADYGGDYCFTIHAISPGGADVSGLLNAISGAVIGNWLAAGDFNRPPDGTFPPGPWQVCPPNSNTYPATNPQAKYDYLVEVGAAAITGTVINLQMSDHLAVVYQF